MYVKPAFLLPVVLMAAWAAEAPKAWTPELQMKVQTAGDVIPSPDGRWAAWTQTRPVMDSEKSESLTQVFLGRSDGSEAFQLTQGEKGSTAPRFSPDGRSVLFASERSGKRNLYRIAIDGGESEALTDWKGVLGIFEVSPNGRWIAFAASGCPGPTGRLDLRRGERHGRAHRGTGCGESLTSRLGEGAALREPRN